MTGWSQARLDFFVDECKKDAAAGKQWKENFKDQGVEKDRPDCFGFVVDR